MAVGSFPAHVAFAQGMRLNRLISAVLKHDDLSIRVGGGEGNETTSDWTRDRAEIQSATAKTDPTYYVVGRNGEEVGRVVLTFGADDDAVSDWSWADGSEGAEALMNQLVEV
ncbi:hypothetical protein [Aliiruegeria sabulilitoris]|uniref:hypothetical protein n=1 Tax=Aliiruegeria sabulilitoris TaxID=1510458 RepID=UPI000832ABFD|nr:hypothetical protein [Aliiruegeria sabulilitoris]NDR58649.1 hypothetical protein [Pseudoruegeria sp. M32A2M]